MYILAIVLLIVNFLLMLIFYFKIKRNFSLERYEQLMQDRMNSILRDFNFQTNQAITILEERIDEMKGLIADADKRFLALSKKMNASSHQEEMLKREAIVPQERNENPSTFLSETDNIGDNLTQPAKVAMQPSSQLSPQEASYQDLQHLQQDASQNDAILKMKVVEMYKNGWSIDFIADKLEMPREEVRIITFMAKTQEGRDV